MCVNVCVRVWVLGLEESTACRLAYKRIRVITFNSDINCMLNVCASFWEHFVSAAELATRLASANTNRHTHTRAHKQILSHVAAACRGRSSLSLAHSLVISPGWLVRSFAHFNFPQWMKIFHGKVVVAASVAVVLFCCLREQRGAVKQIKIKDTNIINVLNLSIQF